MELWDYQKEAKEFVREAKRAYLAMGLGTGKTLTSISTAEELGAKHILLIAEKNEIVNSQNFKKEVEAHFEMSYHLLRSEKKGVTGVDWDMPHGRCLCGANPDLLAKVDIDKALEHFDTIIIDEATLAKTTTTKRFKMVKKLCDKADYLVLLSGTPMMNGAAELYAPLLLMGHKLAGKGREKDKVAFESIFAGGHKKQIRKLPAGMTYAEAMRTRYRHTHFAWWAKGANHVRELRYLIGDAFYFKRKEDTGKFKTKHRLVKTVTMTPQWEKEYREAWDEYWKALKSSPEVGKKKLENVSELRKLIENGKCYQVNSRWKAKYVAEEIANGSYGSQRIVVFCLYVETYDLLAKELEKRGVSHRFFEDVQEWKEGDEQVLIGRIKSHGKGGNTPEASTCLFVDMDFVPANNIQAENRIDRPEQKNEMKVVYYITEDNDVDSNIRKINQDKMRKIDAFMRPFTIEELNEMPEKVEELFEKYKKHFVVLGISDVPELVKDIPEPKVARPPFDVFVHDGKRKKKIGTAYPDEKVFRKKVALSKHLFKVLDAWGMDSSTLEKIAAKDYILEVTDTDEGIMYTVSAKKFKEIGQYYHFKASNIDHKTQMFLPRKEWETKKVATF